MLKNEEHDLLARIKPHINEGVVHDMFTLLKYYEQKAIEKLVDASEPDVKHLQGEIKSLRRVVTRIKSFEVKKLDTQ